MAAAPDRIPFPFHDISSTGDAHLRPTVADGRAYLLSGVMVAGANQGCSLSPLQPHSLTISVRLSAHPPDGSVLRAASQGQHRSACITQHLQRSSSAGVSEVQLRLSEGKHLRFLYLSKYADTKTSAEPESGVLIPNTYLRRVEEGAPRSNKGGCITPQTRHLTKTRGTYTLRGTQPGRRVLERATEAKKSFAP